jgi:Biotin carboxyl carrier protein
MKYIVSINDREYEVDVEKGKASIAKSTAIVQQSAKPVPPAPQSGKESAASEAVPSVNGTPVKAPFSGTILQIKTSIGSKVKKGDLLLILEAMKMENEILAPCDGTIMQLSVTKGASVSTGDLLATLQ